MPPGSTRTLAAAGAAALALALFCAGALAPVAAAAVALDATEQPQTAEVHAAETTPAPDAPPAAPPAAGGASADAPAEPQEPPPELQVAQGRMRGAVLPSRGGRLIYAFRGIPYGQPPVGALRFMAPVPAGPWEGVLDASADGAFCVQKNYLVPPYPVSGTEDCLYLNVYTPKLDPSAKLPVLVYIHGGGFFTGSGASYFNGPQYLLDHDLVFVTLNYRLGALGFLSSGDARAPGNAGLKDQNLALRWVKKNIAAFGGDPGLVTIMGQSAGAASVHFQMLSPLSKGLFHRAISQSGTALSSWAKTMDPAPIALQQAQFAGCNAVSMDDALACLRRVDAYNLTESGHRFHFWDIDPLTVFRPVVEAPAPGAFLVDEPAVIMQMGDFAHVPWLLGAVPQEGLIRALPILSNASLAADLNARWDELMPQLMELEPSAPADAIPAIWQSISDFYVGDAQPHVALDRPQPFIDMYSDRGFLHGFRRAAQMHARAGHKRIFIYELAYRGRFSFSMLFGGGLKDYGVSHCDDLLYLLYAPALFPDMPAPGSADEDAVNTLTQLWANFAKYGDPTPTSRESPPAHPAPRLRVAGAHKGRNQGKDADEAEQCWSSAAEAQWAPYEVSARAQDCDLRFLHIDAAHTPAATPALQAPDAATASASAEEPASTVGAPAARQAAATGGHLKMCMRKGFHRRRLDFWSKLPINENKLLSFERLLLPFFYLVGVIF